MVTGAINLAMPVGATDGQRRRRFVGKIPMNCDKSQRRAWVARQPNQRSNRMTSRPRSGERQIPSWRPPAARCPERPACGGLSTKKGRRVATARRPCRVLSAHHRMEQQPRFYAALLAPDGAKMSLPWQFKHNCPMNPCSKRARSMDAYDRDLESASLDSVIWRSQLSPTLKPRAVLAGRYSGQSGHLNGVSAR